MLKISLQLGAMILLNLLAFLSVGHILDALFKTEYLWKLLFLALSIPVLGFIMTTKIKKTLSELEKISSNGK